MKQVASTQYKDSASLLQSRYNEVSQQKAETSKLYVKARQKGDEANIATFESRLKQLSNQQDSCTKEFGRLSKLSTGKKDNGADYVFLSFIKTYLPAGLKGLLIAIVFLAAWGSIAAALNSLAASTVVDFQQRFGTTKAAAQEYNIAKWYTSGWGVFCIAVAEFAHNLGQSLIETVNVLGSLFYGVILGIFLVAFYLKKVKGTAVFAAALIVEVFIVVLFFNKEIRFLSWLPDISFLWLNAVGAIGVMLLSLLFQGVQKKAS